MDFYDRMLANWPVEYSETDVETSFGMTHVIATGREGSPPLVLLHGSTSNATTWAGDILGYSREFRVYAVDMPGEPGKSAQNRLSWENEDYPVWLSQVFDLLNLTKLHIVGLSLGAWAALKFAAVFPKKAGKIALIAPGGVVNPNMKAVMKMISYASQGEKGIEKTLRLLFPDDFESAEVRNFSHCSMNISLFVLKQSSRFLTVNFPRYRARFLWFAVQKMLSSILRKQKCG